MMQFPSSKFPINRLFQILTPPQSRTENLPPGDIDIIKIHVFLLNLLLSELSTT